MARPARLHIPTSRSFQLFTTQSNLTPRTLLLSHDGESESYSERANLLTSHSQLGFDPPSPDKEPEDDVHPSFCSALRRLDLLGFAKCFSVVCGALVACALTVLVFMSLSNKVDSDILDADYYSDSGATASNVTASSTSVFRIDYSMYSTFPLTPLQYEEECWKQMKQHSNNGAYWFEPPEGFADTPHPLVNTGGVCSSSITYMLDGSTSGLVSELAIMAQAAALAREVGELSSSIVEDESLAQGLISYISEEVPFS